MRKKNFYFQSTVHHLLWIDIETRSFNMGSNVTKFQVPTQIFFLQTAMILSGFVIKEKTFFMFQNTVNKLVEQEGPSVGFSSWPQQFVNAFRVKVDGKLVE